MLGNNVTNYIAIVQIPLNPYKLKTALCKVAKAVLKKLVVVGFEVDFATLFQKAFVKLKLGRVGEAAFVVLATGPRVTEVYINPVNFVIFGDNLKNLFNIKGYKGDVFNLASFFFKTSYNVSSADAQHVAFNVHGNEIYVGISQGFLSHKGTLATAYFKLQRLLLAEEICPFALEFFGGFYIEIAGVKLRLSPFLFTDPHKITLNTIF